MKIHKSLFLIAVCIVSCFNMNGQAIIRLNYNWHNNRQPFSCENMSDTQFVYFTYGEDMGVRYGFQYNFKPNIPDGEYQLFVNDTLACKGFFKNGTKTGNWYQYHKEGGYDMIPYANGKLLGYETDYDKHNNVESITYGNDNDMAIRTIFYSNGKPKLREFFVKNIDHSEIIRREYFTEQGSLKEMKEYSYHNGISTEKTLIGQGKKLNGKRMFQYNATMFTVSYKMNRIIGFKFNNTETHIVISEGNHGL